MHASLVFRVAVAAVHQHVAPASSFSTFEDGTNAPPTSSWGWARSFSEAVTAKPPHRASPEEAPVTGAVATSSSAAREDRGPIGEG